MILAKPAWAAFKNMLRAAIRNPLWAFLSLIAAPFRVWKPLLQSFFILFVILFVVGLGGRMVLRDFGGFGPGSIPVIAWDGVTLLIMAATAFRLITAPLILHFGVTTRKWRICPTFKNVSGTQVGLTVDVVAFSALRAS